MDHSPEQQVNTHLQPIPTYTEYQDLRRTGELTISSNNDISTYGFPAGQNHPSCFKVNTFNIAVQKNVHTQWFRFVPHNLMVVCTMNCSVTRFPQSEYSKQFRSTILTSMEPHISGRSLPDRLFCAIFFHLHISSSQAPLALWLPWVGQARCPIPERSELHLTRPEFLPQSNAKSVNRPQVAPLNSTHRKNFGSSLDYDNLKLLQSTGNRTCKASQTCSYNDDFHCWLLQAFCWLRIGRTGTRLSLQN